MSAEKYKLKFILPNIGDVEGELIRIKGPHLTEKINRALPITSRGLKRDDMFIIPVEVIYVIERPTQTSKRGDILFSATSKAIIIVLSKEKRFDLKVANLGSITKNIKIFDQLIVSSGVRIEKISE